MAFLSSFYPQPVVAGTTAGTYAEGDDSRISQLGAGSTVSIPYTTSENARSISERFSDQFVNVLDFGADPTGVQDSSLAIQRAIKYSVSNGVEKELAKTYTYEDTRTVTGAGGIGTAEIPLLFIAAGNEQNAQNVFIPSGQYKITRPLVFTNAVSIVGDGKSGFSKLFLDVNGDYNAIESSGQWILREKSGADGTNFVYAQTAINGDYVAGTQIRNLIIDVDWSYNVPHPRLNTETYSWYPQLNGTLFTTCTGSSGDMVVTLSHNFVYLPVGTKIRFKNLPTAHTVVSSTQNTLTITPALPTTLSSSNHLLYGVKAQSGIRVGGGENVVIDRVFVSRMAGNGIHIVEGSPSALITNSMVSNCDVAYRMDVSPFTMIQPSGDGNNVFIQCTNKYWGNVFGIKLEDNRASSNPYFQSLPYPQTSFRCVFDLYAVDTGSHNTLNVIGGQIGIFGPAVTGAISDFKTNPRPLIRRSEAGVVGSINWMGTRTGARGESFVEVRSYRTNALVSGRQVGQGFDGLDTWAHLGGYPAYFDSSENFFEVPLFNANTRFRMRQEASVGGFPTYSGGGIMMDKGTLKRLNPATFTRSGTVATFQYKNFDNTGNEDHNLDVGDWIQIYEYTVRDPAGTSLSLLSGSSNGIAQTQVYRVVSVPTSSTFTLEVADSGATSGTLYFRSYKIARFHTIENNCHRFDLPAPRGDNSNADRRAYCVFDSENNMLVGLSSSQINEGKWWTKDELAIGGTMGSPASRILTGTGAPSATAPNGSIYLRTDGDPSSTVYVRAGDQWRPLGAYEP
jgi:hypothetical protein